jgi:hypothetical protein
MRAAVDRRDHRPELPAAFATRHDPVELAGLFAQHAATLLDAR